MLGTEPLLPSQPAAVDGSHEGEHPQQTGFPGALTVRPEEGVRPSNDNSGRKGQNQLPQKGGN